MSSKTLQRSFAGGEITEELAGRSDLVKYATGLSLCRNFITLPHGPAARRPGFEFINEAFTSSSAVRLMPFTFSATQTAVLEFGNLYVRFHIDGGTLLEAAVTVTGVAGFTVTTTAPHGYSTGDWVYINNRYYVITVTGASTFTTADLWGTPVTPAVASARRVYTLTSTYAAADLFDLHFAQSADVVTITHPSYPTRELRRLGATNWTLTDASFTPTLSPPSGLTATATVAVATNLTPQHYKMTAVDDDGVTESLPSADATCTNNLTLAGNFNTLTWTPAAGVSRYRAYKQRGGTYGYIGQTAVVVGETISTITRVATLATLTTGSAHGLATGDVVTIVDALPAQYSGTFTITVTGATTFEYTMGSDPGASAAPTGTYVAVTPIVDDNVLADTTQSPPEDIITLNTGANEYPSTGTYHEQRRWFAGTNNKPQVLWGTRTGTDSNLTSSIPSRDADAMELRVAASQYNQIRHLVALTDLIAFTAAGEFRIFADGAPAITPTSVSIKPQGFAGASNVQPVVTAGSILYVQAQGSRVREFAYNSDASAFRTTDVSIMAPHRFNGYTITQLAYARAPDQILWAVRNDGVLMGLTYLPDQQVFGWHFHDAEDGLFESVCVVAEGNEDVLYAVVSRTVDGRAVRYIERLRTRIFTDAEDAFYVDSGLTYDGAAATTISGLWHLEGVEVDILADGAVESRQTVTNGAVTLGTAASKVHVGVPMTSDLTTLPLSLEALQASGQGTVKNINRVHLRVSQSSIVQAGPTFDRLSEYPARAVSDPYGSPPALRDGELSLSIGPSWNQDGGVCIRQDLPLPLTVLSMAVEYQNGG